MLWRLCPSYVFHIIERRVSQAGFNVSRRSSLASIKDDVLREPYWDCNQPYCIL
jgi:hypothetical protein